jgi:hypothetical protein
VPLLRRVHARGGMPFLRRGAAVTREECRAEILRRYKGYIPQYTWCELE